MKKREGQTMSEAVWAKQALEYYQALGPQRSFADVAKKFNLKRATVTLFADKYDWQAKIVEYDASLLNAISEDTRTEIMKMKDRVFEILNQMVKDILSLNPDGTIKEIKLKKLIDVTDLEKLMKLSLLIKGEPTEQSREDHYVHDLRDVPEETLRAIAGNISAESGVRTGSA
jgi:hypothetical protein